MSIYGIYKNEFRKNWKLALPIMGGQLGQISVNVVDHLMVGQLGAVSLAAVSLSIAIFIIFFVVGLGISFALPPLIARAHGANEMAEVSLYFKHSLIINIGYAILALVLIEWTMPVLNYLGQDSEVVLAARPYLHISAWSLIPFMLFQTFRCYSDGLSQTLPPMIAMILGNVLNVILNYAFIFGKLGSPALGVTGAALGTLISRIFMLAILVMLLYRWKNMWSNIRPCNLFQYSRDIFRKVLALGIPSSLQLFFEVSAFAGAALLMGAISKEAQAAHQIAINLASISFLICTGFAMASTVRVGNQYGQHNANGVRRAGMSAMIQVVLFMICMALIFVFFRDFLPTLYINDPKVISTAGSLLIVAAIFQIPDGVQVTALGALRGIQDVRIPSFITFFSYWVIGLPVSYMAAFVLDLGPVGIWLGLVFGLSVSAILLTTRFISKSRNIP